MPIDELLRGLAAPVLGSLVRRYGDFARCEDAVQEALIAASSAWAADGVPDSPAGWLSTVAARRYIDQVRADSARQRREIADFSGHVPARPERDDLLELIFLCCHPALTAPSQLALTLRAVAGLSTAEIAAAFLVPEKTMGQRISRAKQTLRTAGARFEMPSDVEPRLRIVRHVLYLMFNEGYAASHGSTLQRADLTREAIRLTRRLPDAPETAGLLALMLLTEARAAARTGADGALVPLDEQDRSRWDAGLIAEGTALVTRTLGGGGELGPYQVQAAIAALHDEAESTERTDWVQILALYELLERLEPNPVVTLNRAVAVGMVHGPAAGLVALDEVGKGTLAGHHRAAAVRAHLLERMERTSEAETAYRDAARTAGSEPERRFLLGRAERCRTAGGGSDHR